MLLWVGDLIVGDTEEIPKFWFLTMGSWKSITDFSKYILTFKSVNKKRCDTSCPHVQVSNTSPWQWFLHRQRWRDEMKWDEQRKRGGRKRTRKARLLSRTVSAQDWACSSLRHRIYQASTLILPSPIKLYFLGPLVMPLKQRLENPTNNSFTEDTTETNFSSQAGWAPGTRIQDSLNKDTEMEVGGGCRSHLVWV